MFLYVFIAFWNFGCYIHHRKGLEKTSFA